MRAIQEAGTFEGTALFSAYESSQRFAAHMRVLQPAQMCGLNAADRIQVSQE